MKMRGWMLKCCAIIALSQLGCLMAQSQHSPTNANAAPSNSGAINAKCESRGLDNEMLHLLDVMPLFELSKPSVAQPIDMSADFPGMTLKYYDVLLPRALYLADTNALGQPTKLKSNLVYGFAQHTHGVGALPNHTLLVVERPQVLKYRKSRIWVDVNHNLDLTDDPIQYYSPSAVPFSAGEVPISESVINLDNQPLSLIHISEPTRPCH
jgi:hypothetical protein